MKPQEFFESEEEYQKYLQVEKELAEKEKARRKDEVSFLHIAKSLYESMFSRTPQKS